MTKWWSPTGDERGPHAILFPAGHIAGAASILVQMEGRHLYYTGDLCTHDQPVTSGAEVPPVGDVNVDLLVTESILGDRSDLAEVDIAAAWSRFREVVRSASGSVLVAAAPMGLAQEVLAALAGDVDRLYAHEQLQSATETYGRRDDETSREFVASVESCPETELRSLLNGANVIVAPGSQCQRGTAAGRLAERAVSSPNSTVVLLRDCYDRHLGGKLQRVERNAVEASDIEVSGRRVDVRCRTKTVVLPNHGPPDQLVSVAEHLQPTSIWCVHGADRARRDLRSRLHEALPGAAVQLPEAGNTEEIA